MPILGARGGASSRGLGQFTGNPTAPTSPVTGYHLWLDASDASSFTYSSGSVVSQWMDKSGNSLAFTTAGVGNQPDRTGTQNGKSTVVFNGTTDYLKSTAAASTWKYLHDGTQTTMFIVAKSSETTGGVNWIMSTRSTGVGIDTYLAADTSPKQLKFAVEAGSSKYVLNIEDTPSPESHSIYTYKLDVNNSTTANKIINYLNTTAPTPYNIATSWTTASTADPQNSLTIGTGYNAFFVSGSYPEYMFSGEIAEIITYKSLLSDADRIANVNYLRAKWGI